MKYVNTVSLFPPRLLLRGDMADRLWNSDIGMDSNVAMYGTIDVDTRITVYVGIAVNYCIGVEYHVGVEGLTHRTLCINLPRQSHS
jgi:hypothetical protein